ncbi:MAG TPA: S8 family serine peptidase [Allosphingosinicella sp.]
MQARGLMQVAGARSGRSRRAAGAAAALLCAGATAALTLAGSGGAQPRGSGNAQAVPNPNATAIVPDQYIVVFGPREARGARVGTAQARVAAAQSQAAEALVRRLGGTVNFRYRSAIIGFSAKLTPAALEAVRAVPGVAWIEADQRVSIDVVQTPATAGLDRTSERTLPLNNKFTYSAMGQGVHAYIIDTGIFAGHSEFQGRASGASFTAISDNNGANDCHGHGTHVAGTVGGKDYGIAKQVQLHPVRVLGCTGSGTWAGVIAGIDWVTNERVANNLPSVANMSLAGPASAAVDAAVVNSVAAGVTYAVAAANSHADACNVSPARIPDAITVGAVDPTNDTIAGFSNFGTCLDLFAPGVNITSAGIGGQQTSISSGTSMASPHVAGVAALVLGLNPATTPANVWIAIDNAASVPGNHASYSWNGISGPLFGSPNKLLHWGSAASDGFMDGDPHLTTVDGTKYDFQGAGEFIYLRDQAGMEIQVRHTPVQTATRPGFADPYTGLSTCVSVNSAVAARVGTHRVTLQPNLSGNPDPSGLQLRIDGAVQALTPEGTNLGAGVVRRAGANGMEIEFADGARLVAVPGWWPAQQLWYLNVDIYQTTAREGLIGARPAGSWLPGLPGNGSVGAMPAALPQRYAVLYGRFGEAWRVTGRSSLFDYRTGTSTATFTNRAWPTLSGSCLIPRAPAPPARPIDRREAERLCSVLPDRRRRADCIFDVAVTGERGFVRTYAISEQLRSGPKDEVRLDDPVPERRP